MTFLGSIILIISLFLVPFITGSIMPSNGKVGFRTFVYGYVIEWALFYPVALCCILLQKSFTLLSRLYTLTMLFIIITGLVTLVVKLSKRKNQDIDKKALSKQEIIYLGIFIALVGFQLYKSIFYAYADGDDAFYIPTALVTEVSDKLYTIDPYIGTEIPFEKLNYRYALSPFPVWISYLSRISGIHVATVSHVFLPVPLIIVTYIIFSELSKELFRNDRTKRYMFMVLTAVYVLFSNVSTSTAETFLLTRARQGKEALANIALPLVFLLLLEIHNSLEKNARNITVSRIIPVWAISIAASLMSVFSGVLIGIAMFAFGIIVLFEKRKVRVLLDVAVMALPCAVSVLLYLILG